MMMARRSAALFFSSFLLLAATALAYLLTDEELDARRAALRARGELADYVLFAELVFSTESQALQLKDSINSGRITLIQAMQRQRQGDSGSQGGSGGGRGGGRGGVSLLKKKRPVKPPPANDDGSLRRPDLVEMMAGAGAGAGGMPQDDSGDNLQTIDTLHPDIAEYALHTGYPPADDSGPNPIGPIQLDDNTFVVLFVFFRYRKAFFGPEWHALEAWCNENGIDFGQTVRDMAMQKDLLKTMIFQLYRGESTHLRLVRLENLNRDLKRVGADKDASTKLPAAGRKMDAAELDDLIARRKAFNDALPEWVKERHPEAMMMDEEDVVANGWTNPIPPPLAAVDSTPPEESVAAAAAVVEDGSKADDDDDGAAPREEPTWATTEGAGPGGAGDSPNADL